MASEFDESDDSDLETQTLPDKNNKGKGGGGTKAAAAGSSHGGSHSEEEEEDVDSDVMDYGISGDVTVMPKIMAAAAAANAEMQRGGGQQPQQQGGSRAAGGSSGGGGGGTGRQVQAPPKPPVNNLRSSWTDEPVLEAPPPAAGPHLARQGSAGSGPMAGGAGDEGDSIHRFHLSETMNSTRGGGGGQQQQQQGRAGGGGGGVGGGSGAGDPALQLPAPRATGGWASSSSPDATLRGTGMSR